MPRIHSPAVNMKALCSNLAADQVGGLADPLRRVDENEAVPESPVGKHRYRPGTEDRDRARRRIPSPTFGDVEFAPAQKPPMPRRSGHVGENGELDAFRTDDPFLYGRMIS